MHCRLFGALALLVAAGGLTAAFTSQDKPKEAKPASAPKMDDEMMEKWTAFATPGAEHKALDAKIGKWTYTMKWWAAAGAPPEESTGTCESKWIMDGRYVRDEIKGTAMGMPFEGSATTGFDNMKKKYVSSWIDNMGTAIVVSEGTFDTATKTITWKGDHPDPMVGKYKPVRMTERFTDPNTGVTEFFCNDNETGKEFKSGEIKYTKAK